MCLCFDHVGQETTLKWQKLFSMLDKLRIKDYREIFKNSKPTEKKS